MQSSSFGPRRIIIITQPLSVCTIPPEQTQSSGSSSSQQYSWSPHSQPGASHSQRRASLGQPEPAYSRVIAKVTALRVFPSKSPRRPLSSNYKEI